MLVGNSYCHQGNWSAAVSEQQPSVTLLQLLDTALYGPAAHCKLQILKSLASNPDYSLLMVPLAGDLLCLSRQWQGRPGSSRGAGLLCLPHMLFPT